MPRVVVLDFETYYSDTYSLKHMTTVEYINAPDFEVTCLAVAEDNKPIFVIPAEDIPDYLSQDFSESIIVSHNIMFDAAVAFWRYGVNPGLWSDTLSMARAVLRPYQARLSLDACAARLGLPRKGTIPPEAKNMRYHEIRTYEHLWAAYTAYAAHDAELCRQIWRRLAPHFSPTEHHIIDLVTRMGIEPKIELCRDTLSKHLASVESKENQLLQHVGDMLKSAGLIHATTGDSLIKEARAIVMSNDKLAEVFRRLGYDVPTKTSLVTGVPIPAFAKSDQDFVDMAESQDPVLSTLVQARLQVKSTIERTRAKKFLALADVKWVREMVSPAQKPLATPMIFPLRYSGAHTHRLSGDMGLNMQNLGRDSELRAALVAPDGCKLVAVDASQIEARLQAWVANEHGIINAFASGVDVYCSFSSGLFRRPITKADKQERLLGKLAVLGLGYGMGERAFAALCARSGLKDLPTVTITDTLGFYRHTFASNIARYWRQLGSLLSYVLDTAKIAPTPPDGKKVVLLKDNTTYSAPYKATAYMYILNGSKIVDMMLTPPNGGLPLVYHNLRAGAPDNQTSIIADDGQGFVRHRYDGVVYTYGGVTKTLHGAKLFENIIQNLARNLLMHVSVVLRKTSLPDYTPVGQAHDELIYCVPEDDAELVGAVVASAMSTPPEWIISAANLYKLSQNLPLTAEVGIGKTYLECK